MEADLLLLSPFPLVLRETELNVRSLDVPVLAAGGGVDSGCERFVCEAFRLRVLSRLEKLRASEGRRESTDRLSSALRVLLPRPTLPEDIVRERMAVSGATYSLSLRDVRELMELLLDLRPKRELALPLVASDPLRVRSKESVLDKGMALSSGL